MPDGERDGLPASGSANAIPDITLIGPPMAPPVELQRWLMQRYRIAHRFVPRAAGLHAIASLRHGVPIELPLILTGGVAIGGLRASIAALDTRLAPEATLFPQPGDKAFVDMLCADLFAPAVKTFYANMLEVPHVLVPAATSGVPWPDDFFVRHFFRLWRFAMRRGLKLHAYDGATALIAIDRVFAAVVAELRPGQPYLDGNTPGTRDIVFAVLASPVLLPRGHPATLPAISDLPAAFRKVVERSRAHPAGALARSVYGQRAANIPTDA